MGLADFLAELGDSRAAGFGRAMGGKTSQQRGFETFVNQELPALMQEIEANTDGSEKTLRALGGKFVQAAARAGIPPQGIEKLMGMTVGPALKDLRLNAIRSELQPQPRPAGTEGPLTEKGNFRDPKEFDADMALRAFQATGAEPQHFGQFIRAPAQIAEDRAKALASEASTRKTEGEIAKQQALQREFDALDKTPDKDSGVSLRGLAAFPSLAQAMEARKKPDDPLLGKRGALLDAQIKAANARAQAAGREGRGSAMMQDFIRQGGDPTDMDAFIEYTQRRNPATQTEADQPYDSLDREVDFAAIAKDALKEGNTTPENIKKIAARRGLIIEGTPTITDDRTRVGKWVGTEGKPSLSGEFTIQRKPRVTTKTKQPTGAAPAGPAKSSNNDPLGIRPKK